MITASNLRLYHLDPTEIRIAFTEISLQIIRAAIAEAVANAGRRVAHAYRCTHRGSPSRILGYTLHVLR